MTRFFVFLCAMVFLFSCQKEEVELPMEEPGNTNLLKSAELTSGYSVFFQAEPFVRGDGKPVIINVELDSPDGWESCFKMHVTSGDENGNFVSSAIVKVDGAEKLNTSDFSNSAKEYVIQLCDLTKESSLAVEIRGAPGSTLDIWIEGIKGLLDERDGKIYQTIKIGDQWWMAENLAYLPSVVGPGTGSSTEPYYYVHGYDGTDIDAAKTYEYYVFNSYSSFGVLYNWPAAVTDCPSGWHLPTDAEWSTLTNYLIDNGYGYDGSGDDIAYSMASEGYSWPFYDIPGTPGYYHESNNSSGFTALPGGFRYDLGFRFAGRLGYWWSSSEASSNEAWMRYLAYAGSKVSRASQLREFGYSVRCVRD